MMGTPRYCSINAHQGNELSRRDDLESLGYVIIYFITGTLPWKGTKAISKKEKSQKILKIKQEVIESGKLFEGLPREFKEYFNTVFALKFEEIPDYNKLRRIMKELFLNKGYDYNFDWQISDAGNDGGLEDEVTKDSSLVNNYEAETTKVVKQSSSSSGESNQD